MECYMVEAELMGRRAKERTGIKMFDWMKKRTNEQLEKDVGNVAREIKIWRRNRPRFVNGMTMI